MPTVTGTPVFEAKRYDNLKDLIMTSCEKNAALDAFIFRRSPKDSEVHKTFAQYGEDIKSFATYILNSEFSGQNLSVVGENSYEWHVANNSILFSDSVSVPLDRMLPEDELVALLERAESKFVVFHQKHYPMMKSIHAKQLAGENKVCVKKYICMYPEGIAKNETWEENDTFVSIYTLIEEGRKLREAGDDKFEKVVIDPEQTRIILFTSGTTSMSKGVLLSQKNIVSNVYYITSTLYVKPGDRFFSILPLHHTFENTIDFFLLSMGCTCCLSDGLRYVVKNLQEWHPDVCISVPLLYENIYGKIQDGIKESGKEKLIKVMVPITKFLCKIGIDIRRGIFKDILDKLGGNIRLVVIGGAAIDKRYIDFFSNFGIDFFQGYGLTETAPVISVTSTLCNVHGSVGRPMTDITVAIADEDGKPSKEKNGPKNVGEIITKSDCVMQGYYRNPEATAEVIDEDGWFHTGDMGYIDKTGSIHITGRVKSMIVLTSGKKAFPEEIESLITEIKGVNEAFVWGGRNDREAIDICAKLLINREEIASALGQKTVPTDEEISAYLNDAMHEVNHKMPSYKIVRNFVFSEQDMIKTTTLKIRRPKEQAAIEEMLKNAGTNMRDMNGTNLDRLISK